MRNVTLEELLEAGCHFGHQVSRQNSKASDYIFGARDGIHIIDLEKTKEGLEEAGAFAKETAKKNGVLLVVGTKRQAESVLREEKERLKIVASDSELGLYFVSKRWIGGTLTNFQEVSKNYKKLKDLTKNLQDENEKAKYTKKEVGDWDKERQKLEGFYAGTADLPGIPTALFVIDTHLEDTAVDEGIKMKVPTIGITDTNADPTIIDYPIPSNDDAVGALKLVISYILDAWVEGKKEGEKEAAANAVKAASDAVKEEKALRQAQDKADKETKEAGEKVAKAAAKKLEAAEKKTAKAPKKEKLK